MEREKLTEIERCGADEELDLTNVSSVTDESCSACRQGNIVCQEADGVCKAGSGVGGRILAAWDHINTKQIA
jgi:hypothetical protein